MTGGRSSSAADGTAVSVIIACRRQPRELDLALAAVVRQTRPPREVLVADAGSGPRTHQVIEHWQACVPMPLIHVRSAGGGTGPGVALEAAVERSSGELLLFLDGGSFPHRNWLADHVVRTDGRTARFGVGVELGPRISPTITRDDIEAGRFDGLVSPLLVKSRLAGDTKHIGAAVRLPRPVSWVLRNGARERAPLNVSLPREACLAGGIGALGREASAAEARRFEAEVEGRGITMTPLRHRGVVYVLGTEVAAAATPAGELHPGTVIGP